ncbi:hypothetical protein D3H66_26140, partial [Citrobacter portucalensis]
PPPPPGAPPQVFFLCSGDLGFLLKALRRQRLMCICDSCYDGAHLASAHPLLTVNGSGGRTGTLDPLSSTTIAIINGLYGKLTIGIDGHYTYALNSDVSLS